MAKRFTTISMGDSELLLEGAIEAQDVVLCSTVAEELAEAPKDRPVFAALIHNLYDDSSDYHSDITWDGLEELIDAYDKVEAEGKIHPIKAQGLVLLWDTGFKSWRAFPCMKTASDMDEYAQYYGYYNMRPKKPCQFFELVEKALQPDEFVLFSWLPDFVEWGKSPLVGETAAVLTNKRLICARKGLLGASFLEQPVDNITDFMRQTDKDPSRTNLVCVQDGAVICRMLLLTVAFNHLQPELRRVLSVLK